MSINVTTSSVNVSSQVGTTTGTDISKKSSVDSSFKEEMDKVTDKKTQETTKDEKNDKVEKKADNKKTEEKSNKDKEIEKEPDFSEFASVAMLDVNSQLSDDIQQMIDVSEVLEVEAGYKLSKNLDFENSISLSKSDAEFFIGLTQDNDLSMQNLVSNAQTMINNGAEVAEVKQNFQVSQALIEALSNARENNQPLRIDFDQNVSVILRIGRDGAISANFIPGDKAVEQYLRNNIESLKATFNENDLPYSELSYSNRGSKQQKEQRRNSNNK